MYSCRHTDKTDIGITYMTGVKCKIIWCPKCGAYRLDQTEGGYRKMRWKHPASNAEVSGSDRSTDLLKGGEKL